MNIIFDYSPNFTKIKRLIRDIKFVVIHYTGMQSEIESIKWLKNPKSNVSSHYIINRKGIILQLVKDRNIAWHAGKSKWKQFKNLNKNSIGIELVNKGHQFGYQNFSSKQIKSLIFLCKKLKKKYYIKNENFLGHSDIAPLRKQILEKNFWKKLSNYKLGNWYLKKDLKDHYFDKNKFKSIFFKNLRTLGYRYFSVHKRKSNDKKIVRSFQQHYLPQNVTGKIDLKTLKISHFLTH